MISAQTKPSKMELSPEEFAQMIKDHKPYLIQLEEMARVLQYGQVEVTIHVRAGEVEKMEMIEKKTWLRKKADDGVQKVS